MYTPLDTVHIFFETFLYVKMIEYLRSQIYVGHSVYRDISIEEDRNNVRIRTICLTG
jgi:hypothetical protein